MSCCRLDEIRVSGIVTIRDSLLKLENPLRLESGESSFNTPDHIKDAAKKALDENKTGYVNSQGIVPLREALSEKLQRENNLNASPDQIIMTNGGMHGLYAMFSAIIEPGDEVIIPTPNWTCVQWLITMTGATPIHVPLHEDKGFRFDFEELKSKITPKTKAILINSPHNPTGGVFTREDYDELIKIAQDNDVFIIADEAYEHIIYDGYEHISLASIAQDYPEIRDRIISVFTYSKSYAMTGWRIGYVVTSNKEVMTRMKKIVLYSANGVSSITQWAGIAAVEGTQEPLVEMKKHFIKNRDILAKGINESNYLTQSFTPKGAFYLFPRISPEWEGVNGDKSDMAFAHHLINSGKLGCVPGSVFGPGGNGYVRFSYACSTEMVEKAVEVISKFA